MRLPSLLAIAFVLASAAAPAKDSECHKECDTLYKSCVNSGKTERSCRMQHEKCRKACNKAEGTTG
jgi:hypothetical protein